MYGWLSMFQFQTVLMNPLLRVREAGRYDMMYMEECFFPLSLRGFLQASYLLTYLASTNVWALTACKRELTNDDDAFNISSLQTMDSFVRTSTKICKKQKKKSHEKKELRLPCRKTETLLYAQQNSELMQIRTGERKGSTTAPEYSQKWSPGTNHIVEISSHACLHVLTPF
jgi:hypothetical protein